MSEDGSNGYEGIASIYVAGRGSRPLVGDAIGAATVRAWAQAFPAGATVLDLGSGPGEPSTRILQEVEPRDLRSRCIIGDGRCIPRALPGRADRAKHGRSV